MLPMLWASALAAAAVPPADVSQQASYFSQTLVVVEAESFTAAAGSAWSPRAWGEDGGLFASTVANTFHSRRAHLRSGADAPAGLTAAASVVIKQA
eukprot:SAG31_NODE_17708_length_660_cov_1.344029_1_plen_95_part_01